MDTLFLITGFICASIVPFLYVDFLQLKGIAFYFIMVVFAFFLLAYVILSVFKFNIARIDYLVDKKIVSWNIPQEEKKPSKFPYIISLVAGILVGVFLAFNGVPVLTNVLLVLACAFAVLGWLLMGIKRLNAKKSSCDNFVLSHMGLIFNGKETVFNGYTKGILDVKNDNNKLVLSILEKRKEKQIILDIPEDKLAEVDAFITDLKDYFNNGSKE